MSTRKDVADELREPSVFINSIPFEELIDSLLVGVPTIFFSYCTKFLFTTQKYHSELYRLRYTVYTALHAMHTELFTMGPYSH